MIKASSSILKNYNIEHFEVCVMDGYLFPVSKYMVKKVITATVSHTVQSVCKTMYESNIGSLRPNKKEDKRTRTSRHRNLKRYCENHRFDQSIYRSGSNKRIHVISRLQSALIQLGKEQRRYVDYR